MSEAATGSTAANGSSDPLEWQFLQCFGERTPGEEIQEGPACHLPLCAHATLLANKLSRLLLEYSLKVELTYYLAAPHPGISHPASFAANSADESCLLLQPISSLQSPLITPVNIWQLETAEDGLCYLSECQHRRCAPHAFSSFTTTILILADRPFPACCYTI